MAKLPRITQKIFGKNAPENQITTFGSIKAGAPVYTQSPSQIMNANFEEGWSAAVEDDYAPYRQDRNAVDTALTQQLAYLFQEGIPEWDSGTTYYKGSVVKVVNGNALSFYKSIADNNTASVNVTTSWHKMLEINASNQIVSPSINTPTISGGSMSNGTFANPTFSGTVNVPLASQSSSTDSTIAASIGWANNPSLSANIVHRTGAESISGRKTFNDSATFKAGLDVINTNVTKGTNPASTQYWGVFRANDITNSSTWANTRLGIGEVSLDTSGNTKLLLGVYKNELGSISTSSIQIVHEIGGAKYATLSETPATSDNSRKIATTAFVKSQDFATNTDVVHKAGTETITGLKNFSNDGQSSDNSQLDITCTNIDHSNAPTSSIYGGITFFDVNGDRIGKVEPVFGADETAKTNLSVSKIINGTIIYAALSVCMKSDGTTYAEAPTPATSDNSTKIATTEWVNSRITSVMGNVSVNSAKVLTSAISLNTSYTFASSGLFVITIFVSSQADCTVTMYMSDNGTASSSSKKIGRWLHNGGTAEHNESPFSFPIKKGQSVYLDKTGGGTARIESAYLFNWDFN